MAAGWSYLQKIFLRVMANLVVRMAAVSVRATMKLIQAPAGPNGAGESQSVWMRMQAKGKSSTFSGYF